MNSLFAKIAEEGIKEFLKYLGAAAVVQVAVSASDGLGRAIADALLGDKEGKPQGQPGGFIVELPDDEPKGAAPGSTTINFSPVIHIVNDSQTEEYTKTINKTNSSRNETVNGDSELAGSGVVDCNECGRELGVPICNECGQGGLRDEEE